MRLQFDWDAAKAAGNLRKHGVAFEDAMPVFLDSLALTVADAGGEYGEERWVTVGMGGGGRLILAVHTHWRADADLTVIRLISVRRPTKRELRDYENG